MKELFYHVEVKTFRLNFKTLENEIGLSVFVFLVSRTRNHVREGFRPLALVTGSRCYACLELFRRGD